VGPVFGPLRLSDLYICHKFETLFLKSMYVFRIIARKIKYCLLEIDCMLIAGSYVHCPFSRMSEISACSEKKRED
jgi:hypothetical protein